MSTRPARRAVRWLTGLGVLAVVGLALWPRAAPHVADPTVQSPPVNFWDWGRDRRAAGHPPVADAVDHARHRLFTQGSLAGTEPAGDWCVVESDRLQPCAGLRERFDYYLLGLGEVDGAALRALVERDARAAHGAALAAQILALWDRYWTLRQQWPSVPFDARDRSTWAALLAEQRGVRRRLLGDDWARAFYADEERDFEQLQARLDAGRPAPEDIGAPVPQQGASGAGPGAVRDARLARYGALATQRLERLDAVWADWDQRLAQARAEWGRLQAAAELSDPARRESIGRYLHEHFGDDEQPRVRALLRL